MVQFKKIKTDRNIKDNFFNHGKVVNDVDRTNQHMPCHKIVPHQPR
jgi:hypothetical protein